MLQNFEACSEYMNFSISENLGKTAALHSLPLITPLRERGMSHKTKQSKQIPILKHQTLVEMQEHENKNAPSNMILPHCKMCCAARDDVGLYPIN